MSNAFAPPGSNISEVEVTHISKHGIWLLLGERELFMSFQHFPWFRSAPLSAVQDVQWPHARHLYWPQLDVDVAVESIEFPERFPLIAQG
jgi:hypothetical protein